MSDRLILEPAVELISRPVFLGVPERMGSPKEGQDQGTDAERLFESAGRVCYDSYGTGRKSEGFHEHIQNVKHGSVTEHGMWSFHISGVSRGLTHELVRHRAGIGISQRSTRYVDEDGSGWIIPPLYLDRDGDPPAVLEMKAKARAMVDSSRRHATDCYSALAGLGQKILGETGGIAEQIGRKISRGAARSVLGQALDVQLIWSANLRALLHVCNMRCTQSAEAEIRRLFHKICLIMKDEAPSYFGKAEFRECPDGLGLELVPGSLIRI